MRSALLAIALALAAGCHSVPLSGDPTARDRRGEVPALFSIDWWVPLVSAPMLEFAPRELAAPAIDARTGRVFVTTRDGYVRALSPVDGRVEWEFKTGAPFSAGPAVREGVVYVPGGDGTLYALGAEQGKLRWKYDAGEELATTPVWASGKVLVATHNDLLFAVDAADGRWLWGYRRDPPSGFTVRGAAAPKVETGLAYVGFSDGFVVAIDLSDGTMKWERSLSTPAKQFLDVDSTPVLDDSGRVYVASYKDGIYALSQETGEVEWHTARAGVTSLIPQGGLLFASGDGRVSALRAEDGREQWSLSIDGKAGRVPLFARGLLLVPTANALLFVDPTTGRVRTAWDPGRGVSATPVSSEGRLYVLSNLGYVYAMRLSGGRG